MFVPVDRIAHSNRKKMLEITAGSQILRFPFGRLEVPPDARDPILRAWVDRSGASDVIRYILKSRRMGSVTLDEIFEYNNPPISLRERLLDNLRAEVRRQMRSRALSIREISRRLSTSPTQIYRLLDEKHGCEYLDQLVALLEVLGADVDLSFSRPSSRRGT